MSTQAPPPRQRLEAAVRELYSEEDAGWLLGELEPLIAGRAGASGERRELTQADACLITYADSIAEPGSGRSPLQVLRSTVERHRLGELFPDVHLLPFYPWDTDRGFSVMDYREVAEENGSWEDVEALSRDVGLMFDFVANHASVANPLVQGALIARHLPEDDPRREPHAAYLDFVLAYSEQDRPTDEQLAALSRPRAAPVLTPYCVVEPEGAPLQARLGTREDPQMAGAEILGEGLVWTTFSRGVNERGEEQTRQVDLNFANPRVLLETVRILLFYAQKGAALIRLDAVGYLWKRLGFSSLHLTETHTVLVALKALMELCAPEVLTIAEVNEPQEKVFGYLGSAEAPESDLVYQFTHFPLAVHAVLTGTAAHYRDWLGTMEVARGRQFVTVLGSHDGMGMKPVRGILDEAEIERLLSIVVDGHGGLPNFARLPGGKKIVYEVCATPWCLINDPNADEPEELQLARYRAVVALGLLARGLPSFYVNGAFGSGNYQPPEGLDENRTTNREILDGPDLWRRLDDSGSRAARVLAMLRELLARRADQPAFHPAAPAIEAIDVGEAPVVAARVPGRQEGEELVSLVSVVPREVELPLALPEALAGRSSLTDRLTGEAVPVDGGQARLVLPPYGVRWIR